MDTAAKNNWTSYSLVTNIIPHLRSEQKWSQAELGDRLGVSRQTINAIETGRYDPSLPLAFKLAALFKKPIEGIFKFTATN